MRMVAGSVNPPTLDLANEDLIRSHLHASGSPKRIRTLAVR